MSQKTDGLVINSGTGIVTAYNGTATDIVIPSYYDGVKVIGLADGIFSGKNITSVKLGQFIESIPANAFKNCTNLQTIEWSNNVSFIGDSAFYGCTALNTQIPATVTSIAANAFAGCTSLESITISEKVNTLGTNVFSNCTNLTLTVHSYSNEVLVASANSGAKVITIDCSTIAATIGGITIQVPDTTDTFTLKGKAGTTYSNVYLVSNANNTVIENVSVTNTNGGTGLQIYSANTALTNVSIVMSGNAGNATQFFHDNADLTVHKTVNLTGGNSSSNAGIGLTATNITIHTRSENDSATLNVYGGDGNSAGSAVKASGTLTVNGPIAINAYGGKGTTGTHGECAKKNGTDEGHGENGSNGKAGAIGMQADSIKIYGGSLNVTGGTGGTGGMGGCCNPNAAAWSGNWYGGDGGTGGTGGIGIFANSIIVEEGFLTATGGTGGTGGSAGGIYAGNDGTKHGHNGDYGSGGAGGNAINADCIITGNVNSTNGTAGSKGSSVDCAGH